MSRCAACSPACGDRLPTNGAETHEEVSAAISVSKAVIFTNGRTSNENKMSDGGRDRASLGVEVWKSSQKWSVQRSAVRSIAWLDL